MISLNEIAALLNQIDAILNDSDGAIYSTYVDDRMKTVQMESDSFLSEFVDFDITVRNDEEFSYPYRLSQKIYGVEFFTLMDADGVFALNESMPEQFDYISKKLQEETYESSTD